MNFIDSTKIFVKSGDGGAGCVSFHREKFIEFGGPNGGNGGRGGDIIFQGNRNLNTLQDLRLHPHQKGKRGQHGMGSQKYGKAGESKIIPVPLGTIIFNEETEEIVMEILDEEPRVFLKGGKGGLGNMHFKTSTNRAPKYAQPGLPGEEMRIRLELKLMADVGLVGFPNAGKSTFISVVSRARPKVADYPFTTLTPKLGVVKTKDFRSFVIADIPGIIEGAHEGTGLGIQFLKHIQRTALLAILLDCSDLAKYPPAKTYDILIDEMKKYDPSLILKKRIVILSKIDAISEEYNVEELLESFKKLGEMVFAISSVTRDGVQSLLDKVSGIVETVRKETATNETE